MLSYDLDPFIAPSPEQFIGLFQTDIINFLNKKIIKDFKRIDFNDLSHDFIGHFFSEGMLDRYKPNYNQIRVRKIKLDIKEKEKEFRILRDRNHQNSRDKRVLIHLGETIEKKHEKLRRCQEKVERPVRFKTYLFWCLRSYWWWHVVKTVDIYEDADGVIREHIKTTTQPLLVSQVSSDDDYKFSDVSNAIYQRTEEDLYKKGLRKQAALRYLKSFERFLRTINNRIALALALLLDGLDISEVSQQTQASVDEIMSKLRRYGTTFSKKLGNFGEYIEYC